MATVKSIEQQHMKTDTFINEAAAAKILDVAVNTLRSRRYKMQPPKYYKVGRLVKYRVSDLIEFAESHAIEPRIA